MNLTANAPEVRILAGCVKDFRNVLKSVKKKIPGKKILWSFWKQERTGCFDPLPPKGLEEAMRAFLEMVPNEDVIICESNSVRTVLEPEKFLMLHRPDGPIKPSAAAVLPACGCFD